MFATLRSGFFFFSSSHLLPKDVKVKQKNMVTSVLKGI